MLKLIEGSKLRQDCSKVCRIYVCLMSHDPTSPAQQSQGHKKSEITIAVSVLRHPRPIGISGRVVQVGECIRYVL
ncbi:hypothetical protein PoB_000109700 [Plakobranchus ocellatus]|uniref:Uncharacterized protein n=1 Tax=Plakobranchus ocellatus TaxID=259542 RepID=A0AAV3XWS2_9GAST|nr:hypothetical protein PoB_000109700 [Plakobranchus ocellatus]